MDNHKRAIRPLPKCYGHGEEWKRNSTIFLAMPTLSASSGFDSRLSLRLYFKEKMVTSASVHHQPEFDRMRTDGNPSVSKQTKELWMRTTFARHT